MLVAPAGTGIGRRESASFQSAVGYRPLQCSSAKKELAGGLHGRKAVGAFVRNRFGNGNEYNQERSAWTGDTGV